MAKNTLTFEEIVHSGTIAGDRTQYEIRDTLWYGDEVTLTTGETIEITGFPSGEGEVYLVCKATTADADAGDIKATLTPASPSFTLSAGTNISAESQRTYYLAVKNAHKGKNIQYQVERLSVEAGWSGNPEPDTVTDKYETEYWVDATTEETPIELNAGDTIRLFRADTNGATPLLYAYTDAGYQGDAEIVAELTEVKPSYTAKRHEYVKIVGNLHYEVLSIQYQIIRFNEATQSTLVSGTEVYAGDIYMKLEVGDVVKNTKDNAVLFIVDCINGTVLASLYHAGESYQCSYRCDVVLCGEDANTELTYEKKDVHPKYEAEYEGDSGILQLRHAMGARVIVYADAGAGYMEIHKMEGVELIRCVNMSGIDNLKFVSDGTVDECVINEF